MFEGQTCCLLPPRLFRERLSQLRVRLEEVGAERAPEYTEPLGGLQRSLKIRIQVAGLRAALCSGPPPSSSARTHGSLLFSSLPCPALLLAPLFGAPGPWPSGASHLPPPAGIYKGFCLDVIRNKYECELQGAKQHLEVNGAGRWGRQTEVAGPCSPAERPHPFQSEKLLLYDTLQGELQERIQRLEEDRQSLDISSGEAALGPALSVPTPWRGLRCPARPRGVEEDLLLGVTVGTKWNQAQKGPGPVPGVEWRLTKNGSPYPPRPLLSFQNRRCHSDAPARTIATVPSASTVPVFVWGPKEARIVIVPLSPKQLKKPGSPKCSDLSPWPAQLCHLGLSSASKPRARVPSTAAGGRGGVRDGLARVKGPGYKGRVPRGLRRLAPNSGSGGTEWWDDRLHAGSSAKTWDSLPPSKRKKAPLVSGILPPTSTQTGQDIQTGGGGGGHGGQSQTRRVYGHLASRSPVQASPAVREFLWGPGSLLGCVDPRDTGASIQ